MSESCDNNCSSCGADCSSRTNPVDMLKPLNPNAKVRNVIGVVSGKGGVGKSMVTSLMAVEMQRKGYRAAILDADITGPSIPRSFNIKEKAAASEECIFPQESKTGIQIMSTNLILQNDTDPVVWRGPVIAGAVEQFWSDVLWNDVDYMFVDMPPGTGDVPLTVFQSIPVDAIIVVASPQELVGMIVEKAVNMAKLMNIPVMGLVENMSYYECPHCGERIEIFGESRADEIVKKFDIPNVAKIPVNRKLAAAVDKGMIELFEGNWLADMADAVEVVGNMKEGKLN